MKVYKSKIDWWLMAIVYGVLIYPMVDGILTKEYILSAGMMGVVLLITLLFYSVQYKIEGAQLKIWWTTIDIKTIRKVYATRNPLSSPALSLDRLAIVYNKYDEVLVSPKNREDFIQELLKVNPDIEVKA
ncbi:hypothetical protein EZL74_02315 [Flavobacterium silvisoli]|uniref:Uncharacterized protein YyaB-like PH domain-containing protein n=1 Tax=Flavobacterium silvisoli TaxID=2529433 RepID=A0A4V2L5G5_9FLAO|nr:PH domain-containing protein [Flavobacterium silvisoli]TBX70529.1 hypothetical protein EZL74_02315 [Flavobacterium silvisoli]